MIYRKAKEEHLSRRGEVGTQIRFRGKTYLLYGYSILAHAILFVILRYISM